MIDFVTFFQKNDKKFITKDHGWKLIDLVNSPPPIKSNMVDIPYSDGSRLAIGYTADEKHPLYYSDRVINYTFAKEDPDRDWENVFTDFMNYVHGREIRAVHGSDSYYDPYWEGIATVTNTEVSGSVAQIEITLEAYPFKRHNMSILYDGLLEYDELRAAYRIPGSLKFPSVRNTSIQLNITSVGIGHGDIYFRGASGTEIARVEFGSSSGFWDEVVADAGHSLNDLCLLGDGSITIETSLNLTGKRARLRWSGDVF